MSNPDQSHGSRLPMDRDVDDEAVSVPDYESEQYILDPRNVSGARVQVLRREFGFVRTYFKSRPGNHWKLQRKLNQGRFGTTYDIYLTRTVTYTVLAGLLGTLLGLAITWALAQTGFIASLDAPFAAGTSGGLVTFVTANRVFFVGAVVSLVSMLFLAGMTWIAHYYYPYLVVDSRRRNIDIMLPHAIVYMYALSFGGMDFVEVLRRMAAADETYGDVAHEFDMVVRDVEIFGNDLFTGLRNARNLTPSDGMEQFLDDMISTLDSGGDMTSFLHDESEKYMEEAQNEQENFLETLSTMSEVFVVAFVAAPLFLIVTLMMMSFLGASTVLPMVILIYAVLPLVMLGFLVVVSVLSEPYKEPPHDLDVDRDAEVAPPEEITGYRGYQTFQRIRARARLTDLLRDPVQLFKRRPELTLIASVPVAVLLFVGVALSDLATLSVQAFVERPYSTTVALVVPPFLVVSVPLTIFHEIHQRHQRHVSRRLPDTLDILASANQMGIQLTEGFDLVSRNITGGFAEELRRVRNDIRWNHDIQGALLSLADRLKVPQLTRTCKILAEGSRSTGDLHRVLNIASEDTRHRYRLERNRQQELNSYTVIVVIGFLVYLGVIVVIDKSFLARMTEQLAGQGDTGASQLIGGSPESLALYHALFLHSALIQAVGTGLITGKLTANESASGLKYSIALVLVALVVFALL